MLAQFDPSLFLEYKVEFDRLENRVFIELAISFTPHKLRSLRLLPFVVCERVLDQYLEKQDFFYFV